jgi:hypothetical protein
MSILARVRWMLGQWLGVLPRSIILLKKIRVKPNTPLADDFVK